MFWLCNLFILRCILPTFGKPAAKLLIFFHCDTKNKGQIYTICIYMNIFWGKIALNTRLFIEKYAKTILYAIRLPGHYSMISEHQ